MPTVVLVFGRPMFPSLRLTSPESLENTIRQRRSAVSVLHTRHLVLSCFARLTGFLSMHATGSDWWLLWNRREARWFRSLRLERIEQFVPAFGLSVQRIFYLQPAADRGV